MKISAQIITSFCILSASVALMPVGMDAAGRPPQAAIDPLNTTYLIEGRAVVLTDGRHEIPAAPGSAIKMQTAVFSRPVVGDLDGDGDEDAALPLTHNSGGSGTFYYAAAAINRNERYQGTNAILLGDRIAPMGIVIRSFHVFSIPPSSVLRHRIHRPR